MDEAHSVLKKGGFFGFDIRQSYYDSGDTSEYGPYRNKTNELLQNGKFKLVKEQEIEKGYKKGEELDTHLLSPQKGFLIIL